MENYSESTPYAGWYPTDGITDEQLPWILPGIGILLLGGKLVRILTSYFIFLNFSLSFSTTCSFVQVRPCAPRRGPIRPCAPKWAPTFALFQWSLPIWLRGFGYWIKEHDNRWQPNGQNNRMFQWDPFQPASQNYNRGPSVWTRRGA